MFQRCLQNVRYLKKQNTVSLESIRCMSTKKGNYNRRVFNDRARIQVRGGDGGAGCASFARTLFGIGAPNGGNGGRGGNVYLVTDPHLSTFNFDKYHFNGGKGNSGGSDDLHGSSGKDIIIRIPPGTVVKEILQKDPTTGQVETQVLADLYEAGMKLLVVEGANGGYGNRAFKSADRPKASFTTMGDFGKSKRLQLELKVIADIGLVGFPNAGKSSFLKAVSNADPKIANYPFTTLHPMVGVVNLDDDEESTFSVADLPGLVDGAHMNVGLGHEFLRHIERTKVLLYVIDMARPISAMKTSQQLRQEHQQLEEIRKQEWEERKLEEDERLKEVETQKAIKLEAYLKRTGVPAQERSDYTYESVFGTHKAEEDLKVHGGTRRIYEGEYISRPKKIHVTDLGDPVAEFLSLRKELALYHSDLASRPALVLANKFDMKPAACQAQLQRLREVVPPHWPLFVGSAKENKGLAPVLHTIKHMLQFVNKESMKTMEIIDLENDKRVKRDD